MIRKRIAILFDNFGPYHLARIRALAASHDLLAVQFGLQSRDYAWKPSASKEHFQIQTINSEGSGADLQYVGV